MPLNSPKVSQAEYKLLTDAVVVTGLGFTAPGTVFDFGQQTNNSILLRLLNSVAGARLILTSTNGDLQINQLDSDGVFEKTWQRFKRNGVIELTEQGVLALATTSDGVEVYPSSTVGNTNLYLMDENAVKLAILFSDSGGGLAVRNLVHGGPVHLQAEDNAGDLQTLITGDPDGASAMHEAGVKRISTTGVGANLWGSLDNDPAAGGIQDAQLNFRTVTYSEIGDIGWFSTKNMNFRNLTHGGNIVFLAQNDAGSSQTLLTIDPDAQSLDLGDGILDPGKWGRVTSQFDSTNDVTLSDIPGMSVTLVSGNEYAFEGFVYASSASATPDIKVDTAGGSPTESQIVWNSVDQNSIVQADIKAPISGNFTCLMTANALTVIKFKGQFKAGNAGPFRIRAAQNTTSGTPTSVLVGSWVRLWRIT